MSLSFRHVLVLALLLLTLSACAPMMVQRAGQPPLGFAGPRLEAEAVVKRYRAVLSRKGQ